MSIYENKVTRTLLILAVVAMWALPFSLIKVGMAQLGVASGDVPSEALFAGVRFFVAGVAVLAACAVLGKPLKVQGPKTVGLVVLFGMVNIGLHYLFFYMGVGASSGGRSSVVYSCSTFILIVLSCLLFADDKMTPRKALGCLVGFAGISLVNLDFSQPEQILAGMSLQTDGVLLMAALSAAFGGVLTRIVTRTVDPFAATGYSLAIGGAALIVVGLGTGGRFGQVTFDGLVTLAILIAISALAFAIYNRLLACNPVSSIAIFNSCIPVLGLIFACFLLAEPFRVEYIVAALMSACGVVLVNTQSKRG